MDVVAGDVEAVEVEIEVLVVEVVGGAVVVVVVVVEVAEIYKIQLESERQGVSN